MTTKDELRQIEAALIEELNRELSDALGAALARMEPKFREFRVRPLERFAALIQPQIDAAMARVAKQRDEHVQLWNRADAIQRDLQQLIHDINEELGDAGPPVH
jgi:hypothetical protein